jgi:hypothetical protein
MERVKAEAERWGREVGYFLRMLPLESKTARRQVRRLMLALEQEALAIFKIARRLEEDLEPPDFDCLRGRYGQSAIVQRLGRTFAGDHVELANLSKLSTRVGSLSKHWYLQGGLILDRVEYLRMSVDLYEFEFERTRKRGARGRGSSLAWSHLVRAQHRYGRSDEEVMLLLTQGDFPLANDNGRALLLDRIKKHRLRRGVKREHRAPGVKG